MVLYVLPEVRLMHNDMSSKLNDLFTRVVIKSNALSDHNGGFDAVRGLTILLNQIVHQSCDLRILLSQNRLFTVGSVSRTLFELLTYVSFMLKDKSLFERRGCAFFYSMYFDDIRSYLSGNDAMLKKRHIINKKRLLTARGAREFNFFRERYYRSFWNMIPTFSYKKLDKISYTAVTYGMRITCQSLDKVIWYDEKCKYGPNGNFAQFCIDNNLMDGYNSVYIPLCAFVHGLNYIGELLPDESGRSMLGDGFFTTSWIVHIYQKMLNLLPLLIVLYSSIAPDIADIIVSFLNVNRINPTIARLSTAVLFQSKFKGD